MNIQILNTHTSTFYLGRALRPTDMHEEELKSRISKAWAKFGTYKNELTDDKIPIGLRLKLFDAVITPTILYGSVSWAQTVQRQRFLRSTQRRMLRRIAQCHKTFPKDHSNIEDYVNWVKQSTEKTDRLRIQHKICDWSEEQLRRKWDWAGKVARTTDRRWTREVLNWDPVAQRGRGRPVTRWVDQLNKFLTAKLGAPVSENSWLTHAAQATQWEAWREPFVRFSLVTL
jgi:hypothetical protein